MIEIGTIVRGKDGRAHRLIHTDARNGRAYFIEVDYARALPFARDIELVEEGLKYGWLELAMPEAAKRAAPSESAVRKMHQRWAQLSPILSPHIVISESQRNAAIRLRASELGIRPDALLKLLRRYWQGGCTSQALLPKSPARAEQRR